MTSQDSVDVRSTFKECMTCSRTYCHLINQYFDRNDEAVEKACDPLAGGMMNQGHQCGMIWGATLAAGAKAIELEDERDKSIARAVMLSECIVESFEYTAGSSRCRDIIDIDLGKSTGLLKFIVKTSIQGSKKNPCFQLAEEWYPEVIETIEICIDEKTDFRPGVETCTARLMYLTGGTIEEEIMTSGWGGGIALNGSACGALAAAIWKVTKEWCERHPGKNPPYFSNRPAKRLLKAFKRVTGGKLTCREVCGRKFNDLADHDQFVKAGGCEAILDVLAEIVNKEMKILNRN